MRVLIAGGGTAGHINPGIAIARELMRRGLTRGTDPGVESGGQIQRRSQSKFNQGDRSTAQIDQGDRSNDLTRGTDLLFVGTEKGLESKIVPREGFKIKFIRVSGFQRKIGFGALKTVGNLFQGLKDARKIIEDYKPDLVIGTGGYVCGPVLFAASLKKIPTLIHEQNAFPGLTNKILARFVDRICISFEESRRYFKNEKKIVFTGNPVRPELLNVDRKKARQVLGLPESKQLVVVVGGSRGAEQINRTMVELIEKHYKQGSYRIVFATGEARYNDVMKMFIKPLPKGVEVVKYIYDAANTYSAADVMVCRSGAITITELATLGIPSILIPSPNVTANHQEFNARVLEKQGAAIVVLENELCAGKLARKLEGLLKNKGKMQKMREYAKGLSTENAAELLADQAIGLLR